MWVAPKTSGPASGVIIQPSTAGALKKKIGDLRPRNHLYVTAGASALGADFTLDTSALADGYHELTAVAYEGSHVRTQTRATLPVVIQNTSLSATITLLDLPETIRTRRTRETSSLPVSLPEAGLSLEKVERDLILRALQMHDWNQSRAARYLGITRHTLLYRMDKHGIERPGGRGGHVEERDAPKDGQDGSAS